MPRTPDLKMTAKDRDAYDGAVADFWDTTRLAGMAAERCREIVFNSIEASGGDPEESAVHQWWDGALTHLIAFTDFEGYDDALDEDAQ